MSNSNNTEVRVVPESGYGVPSGTVYAEFPVNSIAINPTKETVQSDIIRKDRQIVDDRPVSFNPAGNLELDLHDQIPEIVLESLLQNSFNKETLTDANREGQYSLVASSDTIVFALEDDYVRFKGAGIVKITGSAVEGNNGRKTILSADPVTRTLQLEAGSIVADDDVETTVALTLYCNWITNGTDAKTFSVEELYDIEGVDVYTLTTGVGVSSASISMENVSKVTATIDLVGKEWVASSSSASTSVTPANDTFIVNTSSDLSPVSNLYDGITALNLSIENSLRVRNELGSLYSKKHGSGTLNVSGNFTAYFGSDLTKINSFLNHSDVPISVGADNGRFGFRITIPRAKVNFDGAPITGRDTDVAADFPFQGIKQLGAGGYTIRLDYVK